MGSISIQLHATPEEMVTFLEEWVEEHRLFPVAIWSRPPRVESLAGRNIRSEVALRGMPSYFRLTTKPPQLGASSEREFDRRNPDSLLVDIGSEWEGGMKESFVGAKTDAAQAFALWSRIARKLRRETLSGATAVSVQTGAKARIKTHRYTRGALALARQGKKMWALGGKSLYEFDTPPDGPGQA